MQCKHLRTIADLTREDIEEIFETTTALKRQDVTTALDIARGKTLGLVFGKPSMRTRVSFEVAMTQLGGHSTYMSQSDIGLGKREAIKDIARVLSRYVDVLAVRTFGQEIVDELAANATIPVINALTDYAHPCQALADMQTIREKFGTDTTKLKIAFIGDSNNVARSLAMVCCMCKTPMVVASPEGYAFSENFLHRLQAYAGEDAQFFSQTHDPQAAAKDADVIYTDIWASMGQESEAEERREIFRPYQVNADLLALAREHVIVMHCLPAHRGEEITDDVMDGPHSVVYDQAENRLHVQKAILKILLENGRG